MAPEPIILQPHGFGTFAIYWYGVLMVAGALAVFVVARLGVRDDRRLAAHVAPLCVFGTVAVLAGGRLGALILGTAPTAFGWRGYVSAGGLAVGAAAVWMLARAWRLPLLRLGDAFAPAIAAGEAVTRLGTLMAGTGFGVPTSLPWGITFHNPQAIARPLAVPLHPTQLYLAAGLGAIGVIAWIMAQDRRGEGMAVTVYLLGAGLLRVAVESVRGDSIMLAGGLTVGTAIGLAFVAAGLALWTQRSNRRRSH